ncbi:MAG: pantetheine-phosphate adenylyltransferase [Bacteriovoracaceae bacterium]|jgi:pantetheine-phosphate adenylyltransferase|nr:pantetheine-phosphate adenylyltransferase [Halobacteriovoraceae bacterium]MDP7319047.1 pantetheine-phosphate adenylyltransferase [Bacteriovoracaceae bacterium]|tara:strand:- start:1271 stop:1747 length:477 start_codon:yes stop_codon:yes gene_type:complete
MDKIALYAGSFDPFTNGHYDIVKRAQKIFDKVIVLIAVSPGKKNLFSQEERKSMLDELFINDEQVEVDFWDGLIVDYVKNNNIHAIVRGLRPTGDFEIEFQMASMNRKLEEMAETVFLMTGEKYYYISSSLVKDVYQHGGEIKDFVPELILKKLKERN